MYLLLLLLRHGSGGSCPNAKQQEEFPKGDVRKYFFLFQLFKSSSFATIQVGGTIIGIAVENDLVDAFEVHSSDGSSQNFPQLTHEQAERLYFEFEVSCLSERFDELTHLWPVVSIVFLDFQQHLLCLLWVCQFTLQHFKPHRLTYYLLSWWKQLLFSQKCSLESSVGVGQWQSEQVSSQGEAVLELVGVLPVEDISLFNHVVDVVLDVSNQRNFVHIQFFEEVNELLLNSYVQLPYLPLSLLSTAFEFSKPLSKSIPVDFECLDQLLLLFQNCL